MSERLLFSRSEGSSSGQKSMIIL